MADILSSNAFRALAEGAARDHAWLVSLGHPAEGLRVIVEMAEAEGYVPPAFTLSNAAHLATLNLDVTDARPC